MGHAGECTAMAKQILKIAVVLMLIALIWKLVIDDKGSAADEEVDRID